MCVNVGFIASDWAWLHGPVLGHRRLGLGLGDRWACPESARDNYARVISNRTWPLKKTDNCPHQSKIKAFFLNY